MGHYVTTPTEATPNLCYICGAPASKPHELSQYTRSGTVSGSTVLRVRRCGLCERRARVAERGATILGIPLFLLAVAGMILGIHWLELTPQWIAAIAPLATILLAIGIALWSPVMWLALTDRAGHPLPPRKWVRYSKAILTPEPTFNNPEYDRAFRALNPRPNG